VIGMVIQGLTDYFSNEQETQARRSGYANNPIAGGLYSQATQGVGQDLNALNALQQQGGIAGATTAQLEQLLPGLINQLGPYFATAQGPAGPVRASDTVSGLFGRKGIGGATQYTANEAQAQQGVMDIVNTLLGRGVSYEELGQLPVSQAFTNSTMDMYNPLQELYAGRQAEYNAAAQPLLQSLTQGLQRGGLNNEYAILPTPSGDLQYLYNEQLTPETLFSAAQGATTTGAPDTATKAGGLVSSMYGGPLWEALARMNTGYGPNAAPGSIQSLIQQHFNPWATIGGFDPSQLQASVLPILQNQAFTAGA
jgi:hypothetical protein